MIKKKFSKLICSATVMMTLVACTHSTKVDPESRPLNDAKADPTWNSRMSELRTTLSQFGAYLFDDKKFNDPNNLPEIKRQTKKLHELAHTLDQNKTEKIAAPSSDPALGYFATQFKDSIGRAYESLEADHIDYARSVLKTSISYCVSCHTRSETGPKFPLFDNPTFVSNLSLMEQARYYVATRQYEAALEKYMDVLKDPKTGKRRPFDIEKAARSALAIAVRVDNSPDEALKIAKFVAQKSETPLFVKNDSFTWIQTIEEWKKEKKNLFAKETNYLNKIKLLLGKAKKVQRYPADMRGDIYYLQATSLIHDYFNKYEEPKNLVEMLYLAGQAYEPLNELGFWTLHEMYYEQCIRLGAHTSFAGKCYEKLEHSILLGYSGSAGIFVPMSVQRQLRELYELSLLK